MDKSDHPPRARAFYRAFILSQALLSIGLLWVSNTTWETALVDPLTESVGTRVTLTGTDVDPVIGLSAIVSLIALLGVIATGPWGRRLIGVAAATIAVVAVISVIRIPEAGSVRLWILVVVVGNLGLVGTNLWAVTQASRWPVLGRQYDRTRPVEATTDPWTALDHGIDPTDDYGGASTPSK